MTDAPTTVIDLRPFSAREKNLNALGRDPRDDEADAAAFDALVRATMRPGDDDVPDDDGTIPIWMREMSVMEDTIAEFETAAARQAQTHDDLVAALNDLREITSTRTERVLHDDEQLTVAEACCLPELGGRLYEDGNGVAGRHVRAKALYDEIEAGRLRRVPPMMNGKFFVSRRTIKEWMTTEWHVEEKPRISSGLNPKSTRSQANSGRAATGPSQTARKDLARDSALSFVQTLRKPGTTTK
ncbi:hypothetical protein [Pararhizobium sp.]|uniref:hypothetical protein n=1 Tax=Pararhizobium sp. TaxID=1977563 RepID=UPI003D116F1E